MSPDPYEVLGVTREAPSEVLKAAYRRLVRDNHPDVASDKAAATARTASINQAWQLIGDPQKRRAFDARHRLETLERQFRQRDRRQPTPANATDQVASAPRSVPAVPHRRVAPEPAAPDAFSSERARLEAQRRARLEREKLERERARRLRGSGAKPEVKSSGGKTGASRSTAATAQAADAGASRAGASRAGASRKAESRSQGIAERGAASGAVTREARLRRKIMLAAQLFHRERKVDEAVALCRSVLHADGRSVAARELLGDIYLQQGRAEYALMMFDQALLIEPDHLMLRRKRDQLQSAHDGRRGSGVKSASPPLKSSASGLLGRLKARLTR